MVIRMIVSFKSAIAIKLIDTVKHWLILLLIISSSLLATAHAANTVSVSNYPLLLLSNAVTEGTPTSARQILSPGEVGHHGSVSPGDIKAIKDSKFVVWFGSALENNLAASLNKAPNAISLFAFNAFTRYPQRDVKAQPIANTFDPHIWLDPENAKAITRALAVIHSHANPKYKNIYQANAQEFAERMDQAVVMNQSKTQQPMPYWTYHDAYQYLESSLNLQLIGSLSTDHHLAPKASQLRWLNEQRPAKQMCLITENKATKGLLAKLQPVNTTIQAEDLSASKDFVQGWSVMANAIVDCIT